MCVYICIYIYILYLSLSQNSLFSLSSRLSREKGRFEDVKLLITGRNNDVNGSNGNNNNNMTLKEYVNQVGKDSGGYEYTPLMIAALNEHFQIVKYLIEQGEADPNIADSDGCNALHSAACNNKKDTKVIEFLLTNMSLTSINKKDQVRGHSPGLGI